MNRCLLYFFRLLYERILVTMVRKNSFDKCTSIIVPSYGIGLKIWNKFSTCIVMGITGGKDIKYDNEYYRSNVIILEISSTNILQVYFITLLND
jgi:hypothetical protein